MTSIRVQLSVNGQITNYPFLVCPMDSWIMHCALANRNLDFCTLMWAHMIKFCSYPSTVSLPFANEISLLLLRLGLPLEGRFLSHNMVTKPCPRTILRDLHFTGSLSKSVNDSGGDKITKWFFKKPEIKQITKWFFKKPEIKQAAGT
ncbi:hypothetical protein LINGRAHAP2_LOCUS13993, partial [Linum grandiflorum]